MKKNQIIIVISFILCVILFITEILFLILFNISHGITKKDTINLIDDMNIKRELRDLETYNDIKNINPEIQEYILENEDLENYIKENIKAIYLNICYGEKVEYINSNEFLNNVNNKIEQLQEENKITEEETTKILDITNEIATTIDNSIEETQNINEINIIKILMSKRTSTYFLIGIIVLTLMILGINNLEEGFIWTGIPTIIAGGIFLLLALSLDGTINIVNMNINGILNSHIKTLTKTLKTSSIITTLIGLIEIILYIILKYKKGGEKNGEI